MDLDALGPTTIQCAAPASLAETHGLPQSGKIADG
jgi:hypothetical protein